MNPWNLDMVQTCFERTEGRCVYVFGAKPAPDADSSEVTQSDCSGYSRWIGAKSTGQATIMPEGSADQHDMCEQIGMHRVDYPNLGLPEVLADDSRLFIAFIVPHGEHPGHVWLVRSGKTIECHGSGGASSRAWNDPILFDAVAACYELPTE